ncbi:hypothetical protein F5X99DRAFT_409007 [Biscogniauxia marginata]|nr:hypothetical protein F5X99DRAFT_409007 [Biscogniauxia marginata]
MNAHFPSIQAFYSREVPSSSRNGNDPAISTETGDGFTSSEIEAVIDPRSHTWEPTRLYEACSIALLQGGAHNYQISGRLVNFSTIVASSLGHASYSFLVVTDGSAAIAIKLYYPNASDYHLLLGQRITAWTTYISESGNAEIGPIPFCFSATTIYPGRNGATNIVFHTDTPGSENDRSLRRPLEVDPGQYDCLPALMTLKAFISSGYDLGEGKILVCVRSIGPRRTVRSKKQQSTLDLVEVGIFDDTANCILKLWEDKVASAKTWLPNKTVLLISKPTSRIPDRPNHQGEYYPEIGIGYNSMVDVDPDFPEANWLREKVQEMSKRESVHTPFPAPTWDIDRAINGPGRILFTLGEVEDQVRNKDSKPDFTAVCKNCRIQRELSLNPRIIGSMIDESGTMARSKLVWNYDAWTRLFFPSMPEEGSSYKEGMHNLIEQSWEDITSLDTNSLRDMEGQLLYSRVTLTFGWSSGLGRICILGVEW